MYQTYSEFITALKDVEAQLHATGLSSRHEEAMSEYSDEIADCVDDINTACYNDSVREFLRKYDKFQPIIGLIFSASVSPNTFPE